MRENKPSGTIADRHTATWAAFARGLCFVGTALIRLHPEWGFERILRACLIGYMGMHYRLSPRRVLHLNAHLELGLKPLRNLPIKKGTKP